MDLFVVRGPVSNHDVEVGALCIELSSVPAVSRGIPGSDTPRRCFGVHSDPRCTIAIPAQQEPVKPSGDGDASRDEPVPVVQARANAAALARVRIHAATARSARSARWTDAAAAGCGHDTTRALVSSAPVEDPATAPHHCGFACAAKRRRRAVAGRRGVGEQHRAEGGVRVALRQQPTTCLDHVVGLHRIAVETGDGGSRGLEANGARKRPNLGLRSACKTVAARTLLHANRSDLGCVGTLAI